MSLKDKVKKYAPNKMIKNELDKEDYFYLESDVKKAVEEFKKEVGVGDATDYSWIEMTERSMNDLINIIFGDFKDE